MKSLIPFLALILLGTHAPAEPQPVPEPIAKLTIPADWKPIDPDGNPLILQGGIQKSGERSVMLSIHPLDSEPKNPGEALNQLAWAIQKGAEQQGMKATQERDIQTSQGPGKVITTTDDSSWEIIQTIVIIHKKTGIIIRLMTKGIRGALPLEHKELETIAKSLTISEKQESPQTPE